MRYITKTFFALAAFAALFACDPENEEITTDESAMLTFSADSVIFDTLFTEVKSITKRFRAINTSNKAVNISSISLGNPTGSYSLVINGAKTDRVEDIFLRGNDSLLVLVEATVNPQDKDLPFLVQDSVVFETNGNVQDVKLVAWGQDAFFHSKGEVIEGETTWTSNRPHVVTDSLFIAENAILNIEAGSQIYFNNNAYAIVFGSLHINGTCEDTVRLEGIRREEDYLDVAGQWDGLYFAPSSHDNTINNATIRNGGSGIYLWSEEVPATPAITINNTLIENMSSTGIFLIGTNAEISNTIVNNCLSYTLALTSGGTYRLTHNTFANFGIDFVRELPAVSISNVYVPGWEDDPTMRLDDLNLTLTNNIFWGNLLDEILIVEATDKQLAINSQKNVFRSTESLVEKLGTDNLYYGNQITDQDSLFASSPSDQRFELNKNSPARDAGIVTENGASPCTPHDNMPDIGAIEWVEAQE
ncbi:right-handed parallel beta-helix repeat-containing protein [Limibacter armeniacum]|uniref:right-handed parallel beta-helix repeat-containing protein n=1 Tax=Limibacter armeniacum TaxID=466084 RepID=UPI002FE64178